MSRMGRMGPLITLLLLASGSGFAAQPLPEEVNIQGFAKVDGNRLLLLIRLPLATLRDVQFPLHPETDSVDVPAARPMVRGLARYWVGDRMAVYRNGVLLPKPSVQNARLATVSDPAFHSFAEAMAGVRTIGIADAAKLTRNQIWLEAELAFSLAEAGGRIEFQPRVADLGVRVKTELQYVAANGALHEFSFSGDPGKFPLEASGADTARQFLIRGTRSVANASDFLLFLFCLALPLRRYSRLAPAAIALVAGLSLTLTISWLKLAPDGLWFAPLIGALAGSVVLLAALANILGKPTLRRRALLALAGGMIFGFRRGFELASQLQFGGMHAVVAAIAFNAGLVMAALLLLAALVLLLAGLFRFARTERMELIVVSALAADTAWQWVSERWAELSRYPVGIPNFDAVFFASALRWMAILTVFGGLIWVVNGWLAARERADGDVC